MFSIFLVHRKLKKFENHWYRAFETARVFTLLVEHLGYVMRCFASNSA